MRDEDRSMGAWQSARMTCARKAEVEAPETKDDPGITLMIHDEYILSADRDAPLS
jgi:hypothetical protein